MTTRTHAHSSPAEPAVGISGPRTYSLPRVALGSPIIFFLHVMMYAGLWGIMSLHRLPQDPHCAHTAHAHLVTFLSAVTGSLAAAGLPLWLLPLRPSARWLHTQRRFGAGLGQRYMVVFLILQQDCICWMTRGQLVIASAFFPRHSSLPQLTLGISSMSMDF